MTYFFLAIVAGLILAIGFQFLLTNLSLAVGLSSFHVGAGGTEASEKPTPLGHRARRATAALGVWALVSASVALFFATFLAVGLSTGATVAIGAVLGLVIWSLFYLVISSVQAAAAWSVVGGLMRAAGAGVKSTWGGVSNVLSRSEGARAAEVARRITRAVKQELLEDVKVERIRDEVRSYVAQLSNKPEHEVEPYAAPTSPRKVVHDVDETLRVLKDEAFSGKDKVSMLADTALRLGGRSREDALEVREKVEEWLRSTGKDELEPEGIKRDLDRLVADPAAGFGALKERVKHIDRTTIEAVLAQRSDISPEEAHQIVETVEGWGRTLIARGREAKPDVAAAVERGTGRVHAYLESLNRPELNYDGIRADIERLLEEPGAGAEAIVARVKAIDRGTIKALLASRKDLDQEQAEQILQQVEAARDAVLRRANVLRDEVERRVLIARDQTLRQAEDARKTAASAAWWSVVTAVISAIAAAFGGMMAAAAG